jgi:formylglycine-generating enzyme required for sulfatase activity
VRQKAIPYQFMNLLKLSALAPLLLSLRAIAETSVTTAISYDPGNSTNQVLLTWEAIPTKQYRILTTTALNQPWQTLTNTPLVASNNLVRFGTRADATARFYKVAKLDTEPPEIWRMIPSSNAIAVPRQSQLTIYLNEETGIATNSIALTVGTNPPVTLADPRLSLLGNVLTYTPATNQFLGTNGQTITNKLIIADTLGFRATNAWPFKLELVPILASNVVLISPGSALTLVSSNGDTYVFSYTNASSGLTNGAILVSTDLNFAYKRLVLSVADNPPGHMVSLVTTQAALADILVQGTVRFFGDNFVPDAGPGQQPQTASTTISLGPSTLYDNGKVKVEVLTGSISFAPGFSISAELGSPQTFDLDISATLGLDLTLRGTWQDTWTFDANQAIGTPIRQFRLLGCIPVPPPVFCIPVWAEAVWEFSIGTEGEVTGLASATAGFESSLDLAFGASLRGGQWTPYSRESSHAVGYPVSWQGGGSGRIRGYVEPKLTIYLESLAGPTANLRPYLELEANACVQPGQAGVDVALYDGLNGTLAVDVRGWNQGWVSLPSWEVFNVRSVKPIWHKLLTTPSGPTPSFAGNLAWIPCGTFTMGSPASELWRFSAEGPQTQVAISQGFWMGKYEVTQGEYLGVMGSNPSYFTGDLSRPVEGVSWNDAVAYCAALTARERSAGRLPAGYVYRLPTEAEWEYACRAGTTTAFHYGPALRSGMANFSGPYEYPPCAGAAFPYGCYNPSGTYLGRTTTVGSYAPNAWGLYDMHGNVWEWCQDRWSSSLPGGSVTDPQGPTTGSYRVIRGGGWTYYASYCRSAIRNYEYPTDRYGDVGFRVILAPGQP